MGRTQSVPRSLDPAPRARGPRVVFGLVPSLREAHHRHARRLQIELLESDGDLPARSVSRVRPHFEREIRRRRGQATPPAPSRPKEEARLRVECLDRAAVQRHGDSDRADLRRTQVPAADHQRASSWRALIHATLGLLCGPAAVPGRDAGDFRRQRPSAIQHPAGRTHAHRRRHCPDARHPRTAARQTPTDTAADADLAAGSKSARSVRRGSATKKTTERGIRFPLRRRASATRGRAAPSARARAARAPSIRPLDAPRRECRSRAPPCADRRPHRRPPRPGRETRGCRCVRTVTAAGQVTNRDQAASARRRQGAPLCPAIPARSRRDRRPESRAATRTGRSPSPGTADGRSRTARSHRSSPSVRGVHHARRTKPTTAIATTMPPAIGMRPRPEERVQDRVERHARGPRAPSTASRHRRSLHQPGSRARRRRTRARRWRQSAGRPRRALRRSPRRTPRRDPSGATPSAASRARARAAARSAGTSAIERRSRVPATKAPSIKRARRLAARSPRR